MNKDNGVNLIADIIERKSVLPKNVCANLKDIIKDKKFDLNEIKALINDNGIDLPGISYYDVYILQCFVDKLSKELDRKINVVEIGAGTTTRFFTNSENIFNTTTYSLEDARNERTTKEIKFIQGDVLEIPDLLLESCKKADLFFIDGDHSYNFAKFYCEKILNNIDIPVIIHDFLPVSENRFFSSTWAEQFYLIHEFLPNQNRYKLYAYTAISDEESDELNDPNLNEYREVDSALFSCVSIFLPITNILL
jgi:hypothetical protein